MQINEHEQSLWYALKVVTRLARNASIMLTEKGYETFLPSYSSTRQWSDRSKRIELPLFPGYLFCRFDVMERLLPILTTPGVLSILGAGRTPIAIPNSEVEAIKTVVRSGRDVQPCPEFPAGSIVLIEKGPLAGLKGVALEVGNGCRIVVSVPLLQRYVSAEIDRSWARPLSAPLARPEEKPASRLEKTSAGIASCCVNSERQRVSLLTGRTHPTYR